MFALMALFGNLWVWRIFQTNILLFVLCVASGYLLVKSFADRRFISIFAVSVCCLWVVQIVNTSRTDLTTLTNDQIRVRDTRLNEYPLLNFPLAHWFEGRSETTAISRIRANFFDQLDPNLYFFSGHPRERVGIVEFERFPYIALPFFVLGLVESAKKHRFVLYALAANVIFTSFFGTAHHSGNFSVLPVMSGLVYLGLRNAATHIPTKHRRLALLFFVMILLLVFLQTYYYETSA